MLGKKNLGLSSLLWALLPLSCHKSNVNALRVFALSEKNSCVKPGRQQLGTIRMATWCSRRDCMNSYLLECR